MEEPEEGKKKNVLGRSGRKAGMGDRGDLWTCGRMDGREREDGRELPPMFIRPSVHESH